MRAFARFRNDTRCMDFAYVDKLAKENNGVKYLLVRQDLFNRTVEAKGMKTKGSQETVKSFSSMITKKNNQKRFGLTRVPSLLDRLKCFVLLRGYKFTLQWVRLRLLWLNVQYDHWEKFYRYMEDFGYKYIYKLPQFITTLNSRRNSSIDMRPNTVQNCDFMSILYSKPWREFKKPTFKIGDRVQISKYDLPFRKGYKPQFTREVFETVATATRKPPTYTIKDEQCEVLQGKLYRKELNKVI